MFVDRVSGSRLTEDLARSMTAQGLWRDLPLGVFQEQSAARDPRKPAIVAHQAGTNDRVELTYAEYQMQSFALATSLTELGVKPGDVVAVQLPNWWEFAVSAFAILRLGAIYTGLLPDFREREVSFILKRTKAKVLIVASELRGFSYQQLLEELRPALPDLEHVVFVRGTSHFPGGALRFQDLIGRRSGTEQDHVDPNWIANIGFSSGTTGEPKGIINTHNTFEAVLRSFVAMQGSYAMGQDLVNLIASPIAHNTAFLWGVVATAYLGGTAVLLDRWDPSHALDVISRERVTATVWAPTFLRDLLNCPRRSGSDLSTLRFICIAGAPIPRSLISDAEGELQCFVCPAWGMTEYGIGIAGSKDLPPHEVQATDGVPVWPCRARIVNAEDQPEIDGIDGDLQITGPGLFMGYFKRPDLTLETFTGDGWFRTGDRAVRTASGYYKLTGRSKDIIIRGGENIPVVEVEGLLHELPEVIDVAIVGIPDERLGERACAFVVLRRGAKLSLEAANEFLLNRGLTKRYLPERLEVVLQLPKTPSGKIQKYRLRELVTKEFQPGER